MPDRDRPASQQESSSHPVRSPTQARQAVKLGSMRYVLTFSMAGVVIAFVVAYLLIAP
jgi:type VI protein secretion system component VasF